MGSDLAVELEAMGGKILSQHPEFLEGLAICAPILRVGPCLDEANPPRRLLSCLLKVQGKYANRKQGLPGGIPHVTSPHVCSCMSSNVQPRSSNGCLLGQPFKTDSPLGWKRKMSRNQKPAGGV